MALEFYEIFFRQERFRPDSPLEEQVPAIPVVQKRDGLHGTILSPHKVLRSRCGAHEKIFVDVVLIPQRNVRVSKEFMFRSENRSIHQILPKKPGS
jgi:hypothetical protein